MRDSLATLFSSVSGLVVAGRTDTGVHALGNVVTVEPGVYLAGRFGIRIEDDAIVTEGGIENPVRFTKELLTVS